jgi:hypothetical protein
VDSRARQTRVSKYRTPSSPLLKRATKGGGSATAQPTSGKQLKAARRRAKALNRLYETDRVHEGHIVWITKNNIGLLHLVQAMARVIGEERNLVGGHGGWSAAQLADLQSINQILSISRYIFQESNVLQS